MRNCTDAATDSQDERGAFHRDIAQGLAYLHSRLNAGAGRTFEAASFVYALIELLEEKGVIAREEIDCRKKALSERLLKRFNQRDPGVSLQESAYDKYDVHDAVAIDCASRIELCRAMCCKMVFPLSPQDLREGVIEWDFSAPYVIAKDADGYCRHFDRNGRGCAEHASRPVPCRLYDCRKDPRIWIDFETRIVNPKIYSPEWPKNLGPEERTQERSA